MKSARGDSAANGIAERAILTVGGLVRTTKAAVEENVLGGRHAGQRVVARMVHHAAQVICACSVGRDGLTPLWHLKGRKFGTPLSGFGQRAPGTVAMESEQVQSEVRRGKVARVLPQVVSLCCGTADFASFGQSRGPALRTGGPSGHAVS